MKNWIVCCFIIFTVVNTSSAQDTLITVEGNKLIVSVIDIKGEDITYRNYTQPDGPIRHMSRKEVANIIYQDGRTFDHLVNTNNALIEIEKPSMLPGYDEPRPYLKLKDGPVNYYKRVGYNSDYYMAYDNSGSFEKIRHEYVESGCVSSKQEMLQFITRSMTPQRNGRCELRPGDGEQFYILAKEGNFMILCTGMMGLPRTRLAVVGGSPGFSTHSSVRLRTSSSEEVLKYYFYDGEIAERIYFTETEVNRWKSTFVNCPIMVQMINNFESTPKDGLNLEDEITGLLELLSDAYYNACYIQVDK